MWDPRVRFLFLFFSSSHHSPPSFPNRRTTGLPLSRLSLPYALPTSLRLPCAPPTPSYGGSGPPSRGGAGGELAPTLALSHRAGPPAWAAWPWGSGCGLSKAAEDTRAARDGGPGHRGHGAAARAGCGKGGRLRRAAAEGELVVEEVQRPRSRPGAAVASAPPLPLSRLPHAAPPPPSPATGTKRHSPATTGSRRPWRRRPGPRMAMADPATPRALATGLPPRQPPVLSRHPSSSPSLSPSLGVKARPLE